MQAAKQGILRLRLRMTASFFAGADCHTSVATLVRNDTEFGLCADLDTVQKTRKYKKQCHCEERKAHGRWQSVTLHQILSFGKAVHMRHAEYAKALGSALQTANAEIGCAQLKVQTDCVAIIAALGKLTYMALENRIKLTA